VLRPETNWRALTARYCIVESFMVCIIQVTKSRRIKWWEGDYGRYGGKMCLQGFVVKPEG